MGMKMSAKIGLGVLIAACVAVFFKFLIGGSTVALLMPRGIIASHELQVLLKLVGIMLALGIPILLLFYAVAWKYREDNKNNPYEPDRIAGTKTQLLMWGIPFLFVMVMWAVTWKSAHLLDPRKPIASDKPPITIQVVALQWKWLFIYPEQHVASTGIVVFPEDTPVHFEMTADAPMSLFWIPQLGGQMAVMSSMKTQLNLIAEHGSYAGRNTEINGQGYEGMTFDANAVSQKDFDAWVQRTRLSEVVLDSQTYEKLAVPSRDDPQMYFSNVDADLFDRIMMKDKSNTTDGVENAESPEKTEMPGM